MQTRTHVACALLYTLAMQGCGDDLGDCDREASQRVVFNARGLRATEGQAMAHDTCGSGAFCHSSQATGDARFGVPRGLDFDMLPDPTGWYRVYEQAEALWKTIEDGSMPPRGVGATAVGRDDWRYDPTYADEDSRMPGFDSADGREIFRNWLACGAPTVEDTVGERPMPGNGDGDGDGDAPLTDGGMGDGGGDGDATAPDWGPIYDEIIVPGCVSDSCHDSSAGGELDMSTECGALDALLNGTSARCDRPRIVAGDSESLLMETLELATPDCSRPMPLRMPALPADEIGRIRAWTQAGAPSVRCQ